MDLWASVPIALILGTEDSRGLPQSFIFPSTAYVSTFLFLFSFLYFFFSPLVDTELGGGSGKIMAGSMCLAVPIFSVPAAFCTTKRAGWTID